MGSSDAAASQGEHMRTTTEHHSGDLGRRIAEQRGRAGLSREEAASRAGMAPGYLAYLETSPAPNPAQGDLARLAAALGTTAAVLGGAGLGLPPGQRRAAPGPVLETLTPAECRAYLAGGGIGRFLFLASRGPVAIPVNYRILDGDIVFRTGSAAIIAACAAGQLVSFDVDHVDDVLSEGWSVLASGTASAMTAGPELAQAGALGITPWADGDYDTCIRLATAQITGRRIRASG
jgi:transcriptional regulator with XRE-family HTH domain